MDCAIFLCMVRVVVTKAYPFLLFVQANLDPCDKENYEDIRDIYFYCKLGLNLYPIVDLNIPRSPQYNAGSPWSPQSWYVFIWAITTEARGLIMH
jgi:hypothetical protein